MRLWVAANTLSNAGAWMQLVAQNLLVLRLTGSVAITGLSLSVQALPGVLLGVAGGALVDRWPRRLTAAIGQLAMATIAFATAGLAAFDAANGASFLLVALTVPLLKLADGTPDEPDEVCEPGGARDGLRYLARHRTLLALVAIGALTSLLGRNYSLSMAALVTGPLHATGSDYGMVAAALAVGGIAGSIGAGRLRLPRLRTVACLMAVAAGIQILTGLTPAVFVLLGLVIPMAAAEAAAALGGIAYRWRMGSGNLGTRVRSGPWPKPLATLPESASRFPDDHRHIVAPAHHRAS
jgi:hypothetical protein